MTYTVWHYETQITRYLVEAATTQDAEAAVMESLALEPITSGTIISEGNALADESSFTVTEEPA